MVQAYLHRAASVVPGAWTRMIYPVMDVELLTANFYKAVFLRNEEWLMDNLELDPSEHM